MKNPKIAVGILAIAVVITCGMGCVRSVRDGVSIGVTDGLSAGIADYVNGIIADFTPTTGQ